MGKTYKIIKMCNKQKNLKVCLLHNGEQTMTHYNEYTNHIYPATFKLWTYILWL